MSDALEKKQVDVLTWLTGIVVVGYLGASVYALADGATTFKDFSAAVGPLAGLLVGYWVRGSGQPTS